MENQRKVYQKICSEYLFNLADFHDAIKIVRNSSEGKIWLVGGMVFRTICHLIYNSPTPKADFDFIVEKILIPNLPTGWTAKTNNFGNSKISNSKIEMDLIPINNIASIKRRKLPATIENYLSGVPLTIQSIAFDLASKKLIGDVGIQSIESRTVAANNLSEADFAAKLYNKSVNDLIQKYTKALKFD